MKSVRNLISFMRSWYSTEHFYKSMNMAFEKYYGQYLMLHFPYYESDDDDLIQSQVNLTRFCLSKLPAIADREVLEVGCGNGIQAIFIMTNYMPRRVTGIDINQSSLQIATQEAEKRNIENILFVRDNSEELANIESNSIDVVINIESAFHYPNKRNFVREIHRVLKPGGDFLIADIINKKERNKKRMRRWNRGMNLHHWTDSEYLETFTDNNLFLLSRDDITENIIKGFKTYRNWIVKNSKSGFLRNLVIRIFLFINVRVNIYLFSRVRNYYVYCGLKPV